MVGGGSGSDHGGGDHGGGDHGGGDHGGGDHGGGRRIVGASRPAAPLLNGVFGIGDFLKQLTNIVISMIVRMATARRGRRREGVS